MAGRKPNVAETAILLFFHAAISGAFFVSYLTGDEDTYGIHVFSGYTVLAALGLRLLAAALAPTGSPLRLPRPAVAPVVGNLLRLIGGDAAARRERSPLYAWMAVAMFVGIGLAAATGAVADFVVSLEDLHEALGEFSLFLALGHIALILLLHALKRTAGPIAPAVAPANRPAAR